MSNSDRLFRWNGMDIPYPSSIDWGYNEISSKESGRTLDGTMKKDIITTKRKVECDWNALDDSNARNLLQKVKGNTFGSLTYADAFEGKDVTRTFYTGDVKATQLVMKSGTVFWKIKLDFIEQ